MTEKHKPNRYNLLDALDVMKKLRDPVSGCPWDIKQTLASIVPYTLEEVYEVVDAIDRQDHRQLQDELGDLLLQVLFYCQIASESQLFDFEDVTNNLVVKLIRRHPHVFPDGQLIGNVQRTTLTDQQLHANWEAIKQTEKTTTVDRSVLASVPLALPAIQRAQKLQKKAAKVGFDWVELSDIVAKLYEEIIEFEQSVAGNEGFGAIEAEVGDLLFTCVNIARYLNIEAEVALRRTNDKFEKRFRRVEELTQEHSIEQPTLAQMDLFWQQAKTEGL